LIQKIVGYILEAIKKLCVLELGGISIFPVIPVLTEILLLNPGYFFSINISLRSR